MFFRGEIRFGHGFKMNFLKNLAFPSFPFYFLRSSGVHHAVNSMPLKTFCLYFLAPSWVPCLFPRPRNFPQQHISKRFVFPGNNISGTNRFHVNKLPQHRGPKLPNPKEERKSHRKNAFVGPPFVGPKKARFGHGFWARILLRTWFPFLCRFVWCASCS